MKQNKGKARYNLQWEVPTLFHKIDSWIQKTSTGSDDDVHFFSCEVSKRGKINLSNMRIRAVHSHMKDPSSEKFSKHSKNMKVLSLIKKDTFTHLVVPKDLKDSRSATSKETVGVQNVAEVSSSSTSHSNSGISKTSIQTSFRAGRYQ